MEYNIVSERKLQQQEEKLALLSEIKELRMELTKSKEKFEETINVYKEKYKEAREVNSKHEKVSEQYILLKDTNNDLKQEIRDVRKKHEDDTRHLQAELKHYKEKYDDVKHYKDKFQKVKEHLRDAQQQAKFEQYIKPQCIIS
jgi:chromosome segregation ATPase